MTEQDTAVDTATIVVTDVELQQETTTDVKETTSAPPVAEIKAEIKADTKEKPHSEKKIGGFIKLPFGITISHIILIICWLAAIGISIWFIVSVSLHYEHAFHAPVTSLSLVSHVPMDFPSVTVCNWNAERECSTCNITLDHVYGILEDGSVGEVKIPYKVAEIDDHDLLFRCYVFNYDGSMHPATTTGYGGMYALYFNITKMPASALNRNGLQVSFHEVGTVASVFEETNFAVERVDNFFTLTKYTTNRLHAPTQSSSSSSSSSSSHRALQSESTSSHDSNVEVRWVSCLLFNFNICVDFHFIHCGFV